MNVGLIAKQIVEAKGGSRIMAERTSAERPIGQVICVTGWDFIKTKKGSELAVFTICDHDTVFYFATSYLTSIFKELEIEFEKNADLLNDFEKHGLLLRIEEETVLENGNRFFPITFFEDNDVEVDDFEDVVIGDNNISKAKKPARKGGK